MTSTLSGWARSALAPRDRLLPGLGARLASRPRLATAILVALRHVPGAARHVSRPLIRRMATRLELPVAGGFRMHVDTSEAMGRVLATTGVWEPHVTAVFNRLLSPGDVCVDVGAYTGYFTLLAAKLVGSSGRVYALEPTPETFSALVDNVALNAYGNVVPLQVAAGSSSGEALLAELPHGATIRSAVRTDSAEAQPGVARRVPVSDLPSLLQEGEIERLRLVKIDVEGYEVEVLRGLEPLFESGARPAVLVEIHLDVVKPTVELLVGLAGAYGLRLYDLRADRPPVSVSSDSADELSAKLEPENERHLLIASSL